MGPQTIFGDECCCNYFINEAPEIINWLWLCSQEMEEQGLEANLTQNYPLYITKSQKLLFQGRLDRILTRLAQKAISIQRIDWQNLLHLNKSLGICIINSI